MITIRDYVYGTLIAGIVGWFTWYTIHERHLGAAKELAAVQAENARVTKAAEDRIAQLTAQYDAAQKQRDEIYANALVSERSAHDADLARLRNAADHQSHPVLPGSGGAEGKPDAAGGTESFGGLGGVALELADALRHDDDLLNTCRAERAALAGKP